MAKTGRPTLMTKDVLQKLEEVFALGGTDEEACLYADIAPSTLYKFQETNPEFVERKVQLKETPILKARQTVVNSLSDPTIAFKFLERKRKGEFGANLDVTTDGKALPTPIMNVQRDNSDNAGQSA
jgi:hypothetical protein